MYYDKQEYINMRVVLYIVSAEKKYIFENGLEIKHGVNKMVRHFCWNRRFCWLNSPNNAGSEQIRSTFLLGSTIHRHIW